MAAGLTADPAGGGASRSPARSDVASEEGERVDPAHSHREEHADHQQQQQGGQPAKDHLVAEKPSGPSPQP